ncbi:hypothetical protein [Candidatus Brachybacter algidus]|nr:hypothetical protein [Candidatus Brachybacter algidus]
MGKSEIYALEDKREELEAQLKVLLIPTDPGRFQRCIIRDPLRYRW